MKKIIVAALVVAGVGGAVYANHMATQEVKKVVDQQLASLTQQSGVAVNYQDISASILSDSLTLSGIVIESDLGDEQIAAIDEIAITGYDPNKIAPRTEFSMKNFRFSEAYLAQLPDDANNKLATASYNFTTVLDYNETSGDSDFAFAIDAQGIADVGFDLGLANSTAMMETSMAISQAQAAAGDKEIPLEVQLQQQSKLMAAMSELEPRNIDITIANKGELKQVVDSLLAAQGMNHEQFLQVVEMQLTQAPISEQLAQAITGFAKGLNTFSVSASLPEGQNMTEINQQLFTLMGQPEELAKYINLKAKGE